MSIFGTSGIRQLMSKELLKLGFEVGLAVGAEYGRVISGRDTRTSGPALRHAVTAGILASGAQCHDAGVVPTPTLAFAARQYRAGVMLTASHNPPEYNGIKLLNPDGAAFSSEQQKRIERAITEEGLNITTWDKFTAEKMDDEAVEKHAEFIASQFPEKAKLKVAVDCGGAAAYRISPLVLRKMGCEVIEMNCTPTGIFPRDAEPIAANLGDLMRKVTESGADLGIAHDGDADRMMAVDDKGRFISGDKMLIILAQGTGTKKIVTTIDASMAIEDTGYTTIRTKVGDPYVSAALQESGLAFGGETSGAWVFPQVSLCPDGIFAAAQLVYITNGRRLSDIADSIPQYYLRRGSARTEGKDFAVYEDALLKMGAAAVDRTDGIKLNFADGWVLVRPSGTEPKLRITVEAKTAGRGEEMWREVIKRLEAGR